MYNNLNYQMLLVDEQMRQAYMKTVTVKNRTFKEGIPTPQDKIDELIKKGDVDEARFYDIDYCQVEKSLESHLKRVYELNKEKDSLIRKSQKGLKFQPSKDTIIELGGVIQKQRFMTFGECDNEKDYKPYFLFDLFRDNFVNVNFVYKNNQGKLFLDFIDYSDSIGRKKTLDLINKVEHLINATYPMSPFSTQLNVWTSERNGKKIIRDKKVKELLGNSSIKLRYEVFDFSI